MQEALPKAVVPHGGEHNPHSLGLDELLVKNMSEKLSVAHLFTMQAAVIGYILRLDSVLALGDVLLSSPTGSGKTLAYALPIMNSLKKRFIPRLRCLVVLPSRDLAAQVKKVFEALADGTNVSVAIVSGSSSMSAEQKALESAEVLIATPGRLVDHVKSTPGFTLEHVKYLVLDEADRLLHEYYYGWMDTVLPLCGRVVGASEPGIRNRGDLGGFAAYPSVFTTEYIKPRKILVSATLTRNPKKLAKLNLSVPKSFEAAGVVDRTKSKNARGNEERFQVPESLKEVAYVVESPNEKLLVLVKLLGWITPSKEVEKSSTRYVKPLYPQGSKLIFTKSMSSAHRLRRLLEIFALNSSDVTPNASVIEMSGDLSTEYRMKAIQQIRRATSESSGDKSTKSGPRAIIVVCSDVFARGMDIGGVDVVVNYDVPTHIKTYLHRSGRTARAGKAGVVVSIVVAKEAHHFKLLLKQAERGSNKPEFPRLDGEAREFERLLPKLAGSVNGLKRVIRREELGLLVPYDLLPGYTIEELKQRALQENHERQTDSFVDDANMQSSYTEGGNMHDENAGDDWMDVDDAYYEGGINFNDGQDAMYDMPEMLAEDAPNASEEPQAESEEVVGEDSFQDLLRAQLMRNYFQRA